MVIAASLVLSGCLKMEMGVDIKSDDDIQVTMMVGVERGAAAAMAEGGEELTPEDLCDQVGGGVTDATVKDVSDDDYIACQMSGTTDLESMGDDLQHADGTYTFVMTSSEEDSSAGLGAEVFDSFKVSVTFPGKVVEHNGSSTVDGTTVTWTDPDDMFGSSEGLRAVGEDTASSTVWRWIMVAGIAVLVVAVVVVLLLVLRSRRGTDAVPMQPYLPPTGSQPGLTPPSGQPEPPATQAPPPTAAPQQPGQSPQPPAAQPGEQPPPTVDPQ